MQSATMTSRFPHTVITIMTERKKERTVVSSELRNSSSCCCCWSRMWSRKLEKRGRSAGGRRWCLCELRTYCCGDAAAITVICREVSGGRLPHPMLRPCRQHKRTCLFSGSRGRRGCMRTMTPQSKHGRCAPPCYKARRQHSPLPSVFTVGVKITAESPNEAGNDISG